MELTELAQVLKALGDATRLKIISLLRVRDFCVCELVPLFDISQPAISKHLSRLKTVGIVSEQRKGQWVFYSLNNSVLKQLCVDLDELPDMSAELTRLGSEGKLVCE
ncbi:metalloregulator ArsR/SmtB family transcription factor [Alicyclobacillus sp. SO9]|uniref:ArsR/SmtB family transcription factor n=1 Tax=Alicyclobacillus sp. SO9 TaxID=2665646 RepID=UPI0018E724D4|nr:metalloregulator ArsR/SmtB family transcription factor [Alicyclobacillus sp. SO9]QQE76950.1 winged helix-turn-helix transcriptional regulator [Alicyclobacillus sp. SO9]